MELRDLERRDRRFQRRMLVAAILWRPKRRRWPTKVLLLHPQLAIYHRGWGRGGDMGVVAEENGRRLGAVWVRLFTDEQHGHGYIDPETPELAIAVVPEARGQGVGRALLEAMHERARAAGIRRIALSVYAENPAKRLYESLGYRLFKSDGRNEAMVLDL